MFLSVFDVLFMLIGVCYLLLLLLGYCDFGLVLIFCILLFAIWLGWLVGWFWGPEMGSENREKWSLGMGVLQN